MVQLLWKSLVVLQAASPELAGRFFTTEPSGNPALDMTLGMCPLVVPTLLGF